MHGVFCLYAWEFGAAFSFAELPAALAYLQSGRSVGKVVVTLQQPSGSQAPGAAVAEQR